MPVFILLIFFMKDHIVKIFPRRRKVLEKTASIHEFLDLLPREYSSLVLKITQIYDFTLFWIIPQLNIKQSVSPIVYFLYLHVILVKKNKLPKAIFRVYVRSFISWLIYCSGSWISSLHRSHSVPQDYPHWNGINFTIAGKMFIIQFLISLGKNWNVESPLFLFFFVYWKTSSLFSLRLSHLSETHQYLLSMKVYQ